MRVLKAVAHCAMSLIIQLDSGLTKLSHVVSKETLKVESHWISVQ